MTEKKFESVLYNTERKELEQFFHWKWIDRESMEWNTYQFSHLLEIYKRSCRRWEERRFGKEGAKERVQELYAMPKVRLFLNELEKRKK